MFSRLKSWYRRQQPATITVEQYAVINALPAHESHRYYLYRLNGATHEQAFTLAHN